MPIGSAHFIRFVYLKKRDRKGSLPLFYCHHNEHCRREILHYKDVRDYRHLLQHPLYLVFSDAVSYLKTLFVHLSPRVAFANDGFRVEANGSLPSSARRIKSIRGIAYVLIQVVARIP